MQRKRPGDSRINVLWHTNLALNYMLAQIFSFILCRARTRAVEACFGRARWSHCGAASKGRLPFLSAGPLSFEGTVRARLSSKLPFSTSCAPPSRSNHGGCALQTDCLH